MGQSSGSSDPNADAVGISAPMASSTPLEYNRLGEDPYRLDGVSAGTRPTTAYSGVEGSYFERTPLPEDRFVAENAQREQRYMALDHQAQQQRSVAADPYPEQRGYVAQEPQYEHHDTLQTYVPTGQRDLATNEGIAHNDWIAPAAAGVGVAGMAAVAAGAYTEQEQGEVVGTPEHEKPVVPEKSTRRSSPPTEPSTTVPATIVPATTVPITTVPNTRNIEIPTNGSATGVVTADPIVQNERQLGGLESEGAHETGTIFPKVVRHDTNMSISQLHVPGKFPKQA